MTHTVKNMLERLEIVLWDFVIRLMSESRAVQMFIQETYILVEEKTRMKLLMQFIAWASIGLVLGFILGFLRAMIS